MRVYPVTDNKQERKELRVDGGKFILFREVKYRDLGDRVTAIPLDKREALTLFEAIKKEILEW